MCIAVTEFIWMLAVLIAPLTIKPSLVFLLRPRLF